VDIDYSLASYLGGKDASYTCLRQSLCQAQGRTEGDLHEEINDELRILIAEDNEVKTQSRNQVISRFFQGHNDAHLTVTCEV
jgi:hypothetical protein